MVPNEFNYISICVNFIIPIEGDKIYHVQRHERTSLYVYQLVDERI